MHGAADLLTHPLLIAHKHPAHAQMYIIVNCCVLERSYEQLLLISRVAARDWAATQPLQTPSHAGMCMPYSTHCKQKQEGAPPLPIDCGSDA